MGLIEWRKENKVHAAGDLVETLELILQGTVLVSIGEQKIELGAGSIIGISEEINGGYKYDYVAKEDTSVYSYAYQSKDEIERIVHVNQKIAPSIASKTIAYAYALYETYQKLYGQAMDEFRAIQNRSQEYMTFCTTLGESVAVFPEIYSMMPPLQIDVPDWQVSLLQSFYTYDDKIRKDIYVLGADLCSGFVCMLIHFMTAVSSGCSMLNIYMKQLEYDSHAFLEYYDNLQKKLRQMKHIMVEQANQDSMSLPDFAGASQVIIDYSGMEEKEAKSFKEQLSCYMSLPDRQDTSDDARKLRRSLTEYYYKLYLGCFMEYQNNKTKMPWEVKMFLMTGFIDQQLAGEENTRCIFRIVSEYEPDPLGEYYTMFEWLNQIYELKIEPSKNEFDMDYTAYLHDRRISAEITEEEEGLLLYNKSERLLFEMKNIFTLGNRMTFGRVSNFFPFFDEKNVYMSLDKCYTSYADLRAAFAHVRAMDYRCFYREELYANPQAGLSQLVIHKEHLPRVIIFPNIGTRSVLWQEIEGKKRNTSARMLTSIFNLEDKDDAVYRMCGEFRWEMCKTEQGVHWNDLSDPSLTAEYSDYLQYYRKNQLLVAEVREKVKSSLQKAGNNYRKVFVQDYLVYLKYESQGILRLNKVARDILFRYCPFSAGICKKLTPNSQYATLIIRHENKRIQKLRPLMNIAKRFELQDIAAPEELKKEIDYDEM